MIQNFLAKAKEMAIDLVLTDVGQHESIELADGEDFCFLEACQCEPDVSSRVLVDKDYIVVGGLVRDTDPIDPFEDFDGDGKVHFAEGGRSDAEQALGLDAWDNLDLDSDYVAIRVPELVAKMVKRPGYTEAFKVDSAPMERQGDDEEMILEALCHSLEVGDLEAWPTLSRLFQGQGITWETFQIRAWEEGRRNGEIGEKYAVTLSKCHDGSLSVKGFVGDQDPDRYDAVWVPKDDSTMEALKAAIAEASLENRIKAVGEGENMSYTISLDNGSSWFGQYSNQQEAAVAQRNLLRASGKGFDPQRRYEQENRAIEKFVEGCLYGYNCYATGDVYGVVVYAFNRHTGEEIGDGDECWGFLGENYVEQEMESQVLDRLESLRESAQGKKAAEAA